MLLSFLDFNKPIETNFPDFNLKVFLKILLHSNAHLAHKKNNHYHYFRIYNYTTF